MTNGMNWWQKLDSTAKKLIVFLTLAGILGGWAVSCATTIRVNAMALQKSIDAESRREERVSALEKDAATTKAATATSINRITLMQEGQADVNAETARQVSELAKQTKDNAFQISRTQDQLVRVSFLGSRIDMLEKVAKHLSEEVDDLTKSNNKLRRKIKDEFSP